MTMKSKYKLLSYIIEEYLIFYKSLNKKEKIIAFSIVESCEFYPLISILEEYLNMNYISYFSIQISSFAPHRRMFLLAFEDVLKERIIKIFNMVSKRIKKSGDNNKFLRKIQLETEFLNLIPFKINNGLRILSKNNTLILENSNKKIGFNIYKINIKILRDKQFFIQNFLRLIKDFSIEGNLIITFHQSENKSNELSTFFIENIHNSNLVSQIEENLNNLYKCCLIEKITINITDFFCLIWRLDFFNNYSIFENLSNLFLTEKNYKFDDIFTFTEQLEQNLAQANIQFKKLNKNLFLINKKTLFFVFSNSNYKLIHKILERYIEKYKIILLILNREESMNLERIEQIKKVINLRILSPNEFLKLDFKNLILENPQIN